MKRCGEIAARRYVDGKALASYVQNPPAGHCSEKSAQDAGPNELERATVIATDQLSRADEYYARLTLLAMPRGRVMMPCKSQALGNRRVRRSPQILASITCSSEVFRVGFRALVAFATSADSDQNLSRGFTLASWLPAAMLSC